MKCPKCGVLNEGDNDFCVKCGAKLSKEAHFSREEVPAQQAEKLAQNFKSIVRKLGFGEKLVGVGAIVGLISFFLTWISLDKSVAKSLNLPQSMSGADIGSWIYLVPISMAAILALLYFSVGASVETKIKRSSHYLVIGTVFATAAMTTLILIAQTNHWLSASGASSSMSDILTFEFGWWLAVLGNLAIIAGGFLIQKVNLKR